MRSRGRSGNSDADGLGENLGLLGGAKKGVDCGRGAEVCHAFLLQQLPDQGVVDLAQAHMGATNGADSPRESPAYSVEHGKRPEVLAAAISNVKTSLDDVGERGEISTAVGVNAALGLGSGARSEGNGNHVVLVGDGLVLEIGPALAAGGLIVLETLRYRVIEGAAKSTFCGISVL